MDENNCKKERRKLPLYSRFKANMAIIKDGIVIFLPTFSRNWRRMVCVGYEGIFPLLFYMFPDTENVLEYNLINLI